MDPKIKTKSPTKRPYDDYIGSPFWPVIESKLEELAENTDLEITTDPYYVIGFLVKAVEIEQQKLNKKAK